MSIYTYPPATPEQIAELERHAKVKLPEQYVRFLYQYGGLRPDSLTVGSKFVEGDKLMNILASVGVHDSEMTIDCFYPLEPVLNDEATLFKKNGRSSSAMDFSDLLDRPFLFAHTDFGALAFNADGVDQSVYYVEVVGDNFDLETAQQWTYCATQEENGGVIVPMYVAQRVADSFDEFYQMWLGTLRDDIRFYPILSPQERKRLLPMVQQFNLRTTALDPVTVLYTLNDVQGYINHPGIQADITSLLELPDNIPVSNANEGDKQEVGRKLDLLYSSLNLMDFEFELSYALGKDLPREKENILRLFTLKNQYIKQLIKYNYTYMMEPNILDENNSRYYQYVAVMVLFGLKDHLKDHLVLSLEQSKPTSLSSLTKCILERLTGVTLDIEIELNATDVMLQSLMTMFDQPQLPKAEIDRLMNAYLDHVKDQFDAIQHVHRVIDSTSFFSYETALVVAILNLDDSAFRDHVVYPKDLVDYYRQHH